MKKRKIFISILIALLIIVTGCSNGEDIDYKIVEKEKESLSGFERYSIRAVTSKELNETEIKEMLFDIRKKEVPLDELGERDIFVFLYDNEMIADGGYSLGMLMEKEGEIEEIDARRKDWSKKPTEEDYKLYSEFDEKTISGLSDEESYKLISDSNKVDVDELKKIVNKVYNWIYVD